MDYNSKITDYDGLTVRSLNALKWKGIETIGEACMLTDKEILSWPNAGKVTADNISDMREYMRRLCGELPLREMEEHKALKEYERAIACVKDWVDRYPFTTGILLSELKSALKLIIKVKEL